MSPPGGDDYDICPLSRAPLDVRVQFFKTAWGDCLWIEGEEKQRPTSAGHLRYRQPRAGSRLGMPHAVFLQVESTLTEGGGKRNRYGLCSPPGEDGNAQHIAAYH